jgi:hypothetical protein
MKSFDQITQSLLKFESVGLDKAKLIKLEDRVDHKFICPVSLLPAIFKECYNEYSAVELNSKRWAKYNNLYFDTKNHSLYHQHHSGKLNRYKIRIRTYLESGDSFLEIKSRTNKGRTQKVRTQINSNIIDDNAKAIIYNNTGINFEELSPAIAIAYNRITLININRSERVTIDFDIKFKRENIEKGIENLAIIEIKQKTSENSNLKNILHLHNIMEGSISKYCLGISQMIPNIKQNLFKEQHLQIHKLVENGNRIN